MNRMSMMWRMTVGALLLASGMAFGQREVNDFNRDWRFTKGEQPDAAKQLSFDDSGWQALRLPHDWAIAGPFDPNGNGGTGKLPWQGVGWYRKTFTPKGAAGQRVYFDFDGVMAFPKSTSTASSRASGTTGTCPSASTRRRTFDSASRT